MKRFFEIGGWQFVMSSLVCVLMSVPAGIAMADLSLDGPDADPVALLDRVAGNAAKIEDLAVTTYQVDERGGHQHSAERSFHLFPHSNKIDISGEEFSWSIDVRSGICTSIHGGKRAEISLSDLAPGQSPSLISFVPLSPSVFYIHEVYAGYEFSIISSKSEGGQRNATLEGHLSGVSRGGTVQLVIDIDRGVLLMERFYSSGGTLIRETSYREYKAYGSVYFPSEVFERNISKHGESNFTLKADRITLRSLDKATGRGRAAE